MAASPPAHVREQIQPELELTSQLFIDPSWVVDFGGVLPPQEVLEYFAHSPFYDPSCNNSVVKMNNIAIKLTNEQLEDKLRTITGKEYVLDPRTSTFVDSMGTTHWLYVILRRHRHKTVEGKYVERMSPEEKQKIDKESTVTTGVYYLVDGAIFQAPTMMSALEARVSRSLFFLRNAFDEARDYVDFDPLKDYDWNYQHEKASAFQEAKEEQARAAKKKGKMPPKQFVDIMTNLVKKIPALQRKPDAQPVVAYGTSNGSNSTPTGSMLPPPTKRAKVE